MSTHNNKLFLLCGALFLSGYFQENSAAVCNETSQFISNAHQILADALGHQKLNLIILLDVSASIGKNLYHDQVSTFAVELVNFGIQKAGMKIHPDFAHVEIMTFDDTVKVENYNQNGSFLHACEIHDKMVSITANRQFQGRTQVHEAFNASRRLFLERQRNGDKKVLILVTDGEFTSELDQVHVSVGVLHSLGVEIFAIGVGTDVKADVKKVVEDQAHLLCYGAWRQLIKVEGDNVQSDITWAEVSEDQKLSHCPICGLNAICMCAVNLQEYQCPCLPGYSNSGAGQCIAACKRDCSDDNSGCIPCNDMKDDIEVSTKPTVDREDDDEGLGTNMMILALALIGALLLLLLAIIIACTRWRRKKKNGSSPQSFVSFIFSGIFIKIKKTVDTKRHSNGASEENIYTVPTTPTSTRNPTRSMPDSGIDPGTVLNLTQMFSTGQNPSISTLIQTDTHPGSPSAPSRQDEAQYVNQSAAVQIRSQSSRGRGGRCTIPSYMSVRASTISDGYEIPVPYGTINTYEPCPYPSGKEHLYEDLIVKTGELDQNIKNLRNCSQLDSLAVFCKKDGSMTSTDNFRIRASDISHIQRVLMTEGEQVVFPLNGKMHQIKVRHPGNSLYAEELTEHKNKSSVWVINTEHYLIMGIAKRDVGLSCEEVLNKIAVRLET